MKLLTSSEDHTEETNRLKKKFTDYLRRREYSRMAHSPSKLKIHISSTTPTHAHRFNADLSPVASTKSGRSKSPLNVGQEAPKVYRELQGRQMVKNKKIEEIKK